MNKAIFCWSGFPAWNVSLHATRTQNARTRGSARCNIVSRHRSVAPRWFGHSKTIYGTIGNQFVLSWIGVGTFAQKGDTSNTFQLILNKEKNDITVNYLKFGIESTRQTIQVGMQKDMTRGLGWLISGDYPDRIPANESSVKFAPAAPTHVETPMQLPRGFALEQNFPNPFNPSTTISFVLPSKLLVNVKIYDVMGRVMAALVSEELPAGIHSRQWNASAFPGGVYFYRMQAGPFNETKRLVLIR